MVIWLGLSLSMSTCTTFVNQGWIPNEHGMKLRKVHPKLANARSANLKTMDCLGAPPPPN